MGRFLLTEEEAREFAQLEKSVGCDIGAGFDWGTNLGKFLANASHDVDHEKLMTQATDAIASSLDPDALSFVDCKPQV